MNGIGMFGLDLEIKGLPSDVYREPATAIDSDDESEIPEWLAEHHTMWRTALQCATVDTRVTTVKSSNLPGRNF